MKRELAELMCLYASAVTQAACASDLKQKGLLAPETSRLISDYQDDGHTQDTLLAAGAIHSLGNLIGVIPEDNRCGGCFESLTLESLLIRQSMTVSWNGVRGSSIVRCCA